MPCLDGRGEWLAKLLTTGTHPSWVFRAVDGASHLLPVEAPQTYVEPVGDWMGGWTERALARAAPSDDALDP